MHEFEVTDEELARRVQLGDKAAFSALFRRYEPRILRYGRTFLFQYEDIEDAVQDVFIKTYVNINSFDATRKFSSWIYRIAHNTFINVIKKKGREPIAFLDLDAFFQLTPVSEPKAPSRIEQLEVQYNLEQSLTALEPKYREPLVLYYIEEKSYKEIADILRIPVSTVGVRISRAKALLRRSEQNSP